MVKPKINPFMEGDIKRKRNPDDIFLAGKSDDEILNKIPETKEEIAVTKEDNIIPIKKEDELQQIQEQPKQETVNQPEEIKPSEPDKKSKKSSLTIEVDFEDDIKTNCTFTLRQSTKELIDESINKLKQQNTKAKINKSKIIDKILKEAFTDLEVIYNKK